MLAGIVGAVGSQIRYAEAQRASGLSAEELSSGPTGVAPKNLRLVMMALLIGGLKSRKSKIGICRMTGRAGLD